MIPRPSGRRRWRLPRLRHPLPFWIAAVSLTALTATMVARVADAAATERDRWGVHVRVAVADRDHEPGERLRATLELRPAAMVPDGALTSVPDAEVAAWLAGGEVVVESRLAPAGLSLLAARLPPGTRGVAVPHGIAPLPLSTGDRVDVLGASLLAAGALVVDVREEAVTIAVDAARAARVAYEAATGAVTLVLTSTSSRR